MKNAIPQEAMSQRLAALQKKQSEIQTLANAALVGQTFEVLVGSKSRRENHWSGYAASHKVINFTSQETELLGTYVHVRVTSSNANCLAGEHLA
jgi:tRNA-2-methylthio-N6-dimethylallyladenosine synthase